MASVSGTSSIAPLTISGVSSMSSEWQQVLNRAVSIASLPLTQLQNQDSDVLQKKTLLSDLSSATDSLGKAVAALGKLGSQKALAATSSDATLVTVRNIGATVATNYSITEVQSVARAATASSIGFADEAGTHVSTTGQMALNFGGKTYSFQLTDNSMTGLRDKINGLDAGVTATILTSNGKNYLSLSADETGDAQTLSLIDDPSGAASDLLSTKDLGSNAVFKLNGIAIDRASNSVSDVIPGVSFSLIAKPAQGTTVTISLAAKNDKVASALEDFVSAYNTVADKVNAQIGESAGLLTGSSVIRDVQDAMHQLASFHSDGDIQSLWEMGVSFDSTGKLSFDSDRFNSLTDKQVQGVISFLGSETEGFGGISKSLDSLNDLVSGSIKVEQDGLTQTDKYLQERINALQDRIGIMQTGLASRLQAADSMLAGLESQQTVLKSSIDSLNYMLYGKQNNN